MTVRAAVVCSLFLMAGCIQESVVQDADVSAAAARIDGIDRPITIVQNTGNPLWGGMARLREEASIGVEIGEPEYMFGDIRGIAVGRNRIYILDRSVPVVRVYDLDGRHLSDIGAAGEGPGEFRRPSALLLTRDERLLVRDESTRRVNVFALDGAILDTWRLPGGIVPFSRMIQTPDGIVYARQIIRGQSVRPKTIMVPLGPEGRLGESIEPPDFGYEEPFLSYGGGRSSIPFMPRSVWDLAPNGDLLAGVSEDYEFVIVKSDGPPVLVRQEWVPVPVQVDEARYSRRRITLRRRAGEPEWSWNGPEIPSHKPAYSELYGDWSGRVWVSRPGPGSRTLDCSDPSENRPCWTATRVVEVFDGDGQYLGPVEFPNRYSFAVRNPFIRGNLLVAHLEDDQGTIIVKRYRLVLPHEQ